MKNIICNYYARFGSGDCGETFDWDVSLNNEEEKAYLMAIINQENPADNPVIEKLIEEVIKDIEEQESENADFYYDDEEDAEDFLSNLDINLNFPEPVDSHEISKDEANGCLSILFDSITNKNYKSVFDFINYWKDCFEENELLSIAKTVATEKGSLKDFNNFIKI